MKIVTQPAAMVDRVGERVVVVVTVPSLISRAVMIFENS